jgi:hypothetical protein
MSMSIETRRLLVLITGITLAAILVIFGILGCVYKVTVSNNARDQAMVAACSASGGSWIVDGDTGECWQKALLFRGP